MSDVPGPGEKVCPFCAETIKAAAIRCRFCQSELGELVEPAEQENDRSEPVNLEKPGASVAAPSEGVDARPRRTPFLASFRLLRILVPLVLVLTLVAGFAWWRSEHPASGKAPDGVVTSAQARDAGLQAAAQLTQKVLSYDWKTLDADIKASQAVLAPSFRSEYTKAMTKVKTQTVSNQVKLTASPVATSIVSASETKVVALVFVNQVTVAKGSKKQRLDQNRVLVTLTRGGGEWRVSKMKAF